MDFPTGRPGELFPMDAHLRCSATHRRASPCSGYTKDAVIDDFAARYPKAFGLDSSKGAFDRQRQRKLATDTAAASHGVLN